MSENQEYRFPLNVNIQKISTGAATEVLRLRQTPANRLQVANWLSVEDETTAFTSFRVGVSDFNNFVPLLEELGPQAGRLYWTDEPFYIPEGKFLEVRFVGCTAGDRLNVNVNGFELCTSGGQNA